MHAPSPLAPVRDDCAACLASLDAVTSGEVDAVTGARADAHAVVCPGCRAALALARAYRRVLRRTGSAEHAPDALRDRVLAVLRGIRASRTS